MKQKEGNKHAAVMKAAAVAALVIAVIYFGMAIYFHSHFLPKTLLNETAVGGKSQKAAEMLIAEQMKEYEIHIVSRGEQDEVIKGTEIALKPEFGDSIEKQIRKQNGFAWILACFLPSRIDAEAMVTFDQSALKEKAYDLACMQPENQKEPQNAYCSDYSSSGYEIIPEDPGSRILEEKFLTELTHAVDSLEPALSLEETDCYAKPEITSDSEELIQIKDTLNQYTGASITYLVGDKKEILDGTTTHEWMQTDDNQVSIDEEKVEEYVSGLASSYNTAFHKRTLKTSYGTVVEIPGGDYGWKVDKEAEKEQILADLAAGKPVERELIYAQTANSRGENDYGDTYVEINLTAQHLFFYKNGSLVVESDFVSGNLSKNYDTPTGAYGLTYKERDATLKGENYSSDVSYWMPFCNNVGMHDAGWRSSFGGSIYKTSGSHGCVNLPKSAAEKIFENIEDGDPVLVYTLPGSESAAAVAQDAAQVVNMINSIGEVSLASEPAIVMAEKMYRLLPPAGQAQVTNYDILAASQAQLAALKAQAAEQPPQ